MCCDPRGYPVEPLYTYVADGLFLWSQTGTYLLKHYLRVWSIICVHSLRRNLMRYAMARLGIQWQVLMLVLFRCMTVGC
jgi:hypothetical protein